jgi:RNA polymerase II subunit A-like phosphatase
VFHFQLWGHGSMWYHTRLRPGTREFLERIGMLYELHICTFGTRSYAHTIAKHLDSEGRYFSDRILSRDECFSQNSKTANLKELFPRGDHMVRGVRWWNDEAFELNNNGDLTKMLCP